MALKAARDGHDFVAQALEKGAGAAMVKLEGAGPMIDVVDYLTTVLKYGGYDVISATNVEQAIEKVKTQNEDQKHGVEIVRKALSWPARQIVINAGEDGSVVVAKILEKDEYNYGFDAQNGGYVNLVSKGIIDPTKVVRTALQDAASIAGLLITTEAMVAELPKKKEAMPAMPPGGGMDY